MSSVRNLFSHRTLGYIASSGRKMCLAASPETYRYFRVLENTKYRNPFLVRDRSVHSCQETIIKCGNSVEGGAAMGDVFFSRFSSAMSERIFEVYHQWYMDEIDRTLRNILHDAEWKLRYKGGHEQIISSVMANPSQDLLDDVWRALEQVCSVGLEEHVKDLFYIQFPLDVRMCHNVTVELRIESILQSYSDWEEEFYKELELIREKIRAQEVEEKGESEAQSRGGASSENDYVDDKEGAHLISSSCKRSGSINLVKIYRDLSYSFKGRVADKIHETVDVVRQVHKRIFEKILPLHEVSYLSPVLAEWVKLLQPLSVDWNALTGRLKRQSSRWYFKDEESYETTVREYTMLMDIYLNQNRLEDAERVLKKMSKKGIKQMEAIYMTLLRSFAQRGDANGVERIAVLMESDGFRPSLESCSLLVEVFCRAGNPHAARKHFDHIAKLGNKPGLNIIMNVLVTYEKKELYNDAFDFLMQLEKDGLGRGFSTYLEESFDRMLLVNETEQLLGDIDQLVQKVIKL